MVSCCFVTERQLVNSHSGSCCSLEGFGIWAKWPQQQQQQQWQQQQQQQQQHELVVVHMQGLLCNLLGSAAIAVETVHGLLVRLYQPQP